MAYCEKCGAYIPDGQSKCLACGFDGAEEERRAAQAARQQEDQRAQVEQRRRERQEINKKWVESEQRRRERQEASKKWAESEQQHRRNMEELERRRKGAEEKARREAEQKKSADWQQTEYGSFRFTDGNAPRRTASSHNKVLAALSYVSILFLLPLLFAQDDEYAKFHAKQGARLFVCNAIGTVLGSIFSIGWIINLLLIYLMIVGIKNALNDKWEPLPYIGKFKLF